MSVHVVVGCGVNSTISLASLRLSYRFFFFDSAYVGFVRLLPRHYSLRNNGKLYLIWSQWRIGMEKGDGIGSHQSGSLPVV